MDLVGEIVEKMGLEKEDFHKIARSVLEFVVLHTAHSYIKD